MSPFDIGLDVSVSYGPGSFRFIQAWMFPFHAGLDVSVSYRPGCLDLI